MRSPHALHACTLYSWGLIYSLPLIPTFLHEIIEFTRFTTSRRVNSCRVGCFTHIAALVEGLVPADQMQSCPFSVSDALGSVLHNSSVAAAGVPQKEARWERKYRTSREAANVRARPVPEDPPGGFNAGVTTEHSCELLAV